MATKQMPGWPGWETVRLIGRGSFGAVYEIQRQVFDDTEKAALKVISIPQNPSDIDEMYNDGYSEDDITTTLQSHLKSIVAEYSLMRKLNGNANIVHCEDVHYVQHEDGIGWDIFIKMELLTPLVKALGDTVDDELVIKVAKDMCAALEVCREHNIIHRDIKPQNIFMSDKGDYKLGDFGIAKTVEKTMGGTKTGTYKYMAPEVYNNQPYGTGADIYSLGLVLYWLLNERRMPFMPLPPAKLVAGMEEESRLRRFSGEETPAPKNGSEELKRIVLKACAFDPKERYTSAAEMLSALAALDTVPPEGILVSDPVKDPDPMLEPATLTPEPEPVPQMPKSEPKSVPTMPKSEQESKVVHPARLKKKPILLICAGVLLMVGLILMWPVYGPWSEWSAQKPVSEETIKVEAMDQYRFRSKTTTESSSATLDGIAPVNQREEWTEYGEWSDWQAEKIEENEACQVESQMLYRSRDLTVSEDWSDWGRWSDWSTEIVNETESQQVRKRTIYYYDVYRYECTICEWFSHNLKHGMVTHTYTFHVPEEGSKSYSGGNISSSALDDLFSLITETYTGEKTTDEILANAGYFLRKKSVQSEKKELISYDYWSLVSSTPSKSEDQYRYRSREKTESWSDWTAYTTTVLVADEDTQVESMTGYRSRTREKATVYQYEIWGEWSAWLGEVPISADEVEIEQQTLYRYAERMCLWQLLFAEWQKEGDGL